MTDTVVLAFSGGLDTSWCVPWIREERGAEVVTVTVDVGGLDDAARRELEARSIALGASRHVLVDARERFFDETLRFLVMGNVLRGGVYPLCVGAERGLQAREVARCARELGAGAVAHGCTAAGNDQVRFEVALRVLAPDLEILAPIRDLAPSREEELEALRVRGLPVPAGDAAYSVNSGLWGTTIGGRETTGTEAAIPEEAWIRTRGAFESPSPPAVHVLGFQSGVPVSFDGALLEPVPLLETVDRAAAAHGIGRGIHLGETLMGLKGRVAFEAPAAAVLITAHRELEKLVLTGHQLRVKDTVARTYGELVHAGRHPDPACRDIEALLLSSQERVTGEVRVRFLTGSLFVEGAASPYSLVAASRGVYGERAGEWTPEDARGHARVAAIPAMLHARAGRRGAGT